MLAFLLHQLVVLKHHHYKEPAGLLLLCHMLMQGGKMLLYQGIKCFYSKVLWYLPGHSFLWQHVMFLKMFELVVLMGDFKALHLLESWFPALSPAAAAIVLFVAIA